MVDLEPTVAYNHPPFYTQKGGVAGQGERGRKRDRGWRCCHHYEPKSQSHLYIEQLGLQSPEHKAPWSDILLMSAFPQVMFQDGLCACL